ncbi:MAG: glycosyltransferase [Clostridia bacterium]|jgi:glycosyltransferase involved in cell wall biosynthesis|nr:glycosyltransferase [Clostridia bacterium]
MKEQGKTDFQKKKILFVTNTMGRAGAEKCLQALLELLDPEKYDMSVYSIINRGELYSDMPEYVHILNKNPCTKSVLDNAGLAAIGRQILWSLLKKFSFITYIPYFFRVLFHQIKSKHLDFSKLFWMLLARNAKRFNEEYDLAVAFIEGAATYYVADYVKAKKKATYVHIDYLAAGYSPKLDRKYYDKFDRVFCVSDTVRKVFLKAYPDYSQKTFFFHNMVPRERIIRLSKEGQGFTDGFDGLRILTVGRLHYQKAYDLAIPALAELRRRGHNVRWYVIGEGAEEDNLRALIRQNGVEDSFILLGTTPNPYPYIANCDIYSQASRFEGWCIALAESLVLARPVLASRCAGNEEQVTDGETGVLIDLSTENIVEGMEKLITSPELRKKFTRNLSGVALDFKKDLEMLYALTE